MGTNATALLLARGQGNQAALNELIPLVHQELRRLARHYMAGSATVRACNHGARERSTSIGGLPTGAMARPNALLRGFRESDAPRASGFCTVKPLSEARRWSAAGVTG